MRKICICAFLLVLLFTWKAFGAYHHGGDTDSELVLQAYPAIAGSKLDSCALCHSGGEYEKKPGKFIAMGSCQWCHHTYGYNGEGDIEETLNPYGEAYNQNGKTSSALLLIAELDSDGDGFSNNEEIAALRFPGDETDDPTKIAAPYKVISRKELERLPIHNQLMLMNTHKSGDFYAEYAGVPISDLLDHTKVLHSADSITVYAPDGWAQYHPLEEENDPLSYHVYGEYPEAELYYDTEADVELNENGWCDYSAAAVDEMENGEIIEIAGGLKMLLAYQRNGEKLNSGLLDEENRLNGEGPFRVVTPQKVVGPPDQSVKSDVQEVIWPFDEDADHNGGFSTRSATIIKVSPLPEGTTDVDLLEAGWDFVDQEKIMIYGAIDPKETVLAKIAQMRKNIRKMDWSVFKGCRHKSTLLWKLKIIRQLVKREKDNRALLRLNKLTRRFDGCQEADMPDRNDWIAECEQQKAVYWSLHELNVLMNIE